MEVGVAAVAEVVENHLEEVAWGLVVPLHSHLEVHMNGRSRAASRKESCQL